MTDPHTTILWSMAFEHALSLICTPQRTSNGALSWSSPSDEQMKYVRAWADFVADKARGTTPIDRAAFDRAGHRLVVPFAIASPVQQRPPFIPPFVRPRQPSYPCDHLDEPITLPWEPAAKEPL